MRIDARATIRRLRRVVLAAPSLAVLLLLAAAGAASAADGLSLSDKAPLTPVIPVVDPGAVTATVRAEVTLLKTTAVQTAERAVEAPAAQAAVAIVRGARDHVDSVVDPVAPVKIPRVTIPDLLERSAHTRPRRPEARAAASAMPTSSPSSANASSIAFDGADSSVVSEALSLDGRLFLGPMQPAQPLGPFETTDGAAIGGAGTGSATWLGLSSPPSFGFAWRSAVRPAVASAIPRGLTPRSLVPPG